MPTEESLLQAIYEAPDDDAPRRDYATWLKERGNPRGEFVSLQLKKHGGGLTDAETKRESELATAHAESWLGPLGPVATFRAGIVFERGFPATSYVSFKTRQQCAAVLDAPELATLHGPSVTGPDVPGTSVLAHLCGREKPSRLRYLSFELGPEPVGADLAALVHPHAVKALPRLSTLWLNATGVDGVTPETLGWLMHGPLLARLDRLVVTGLAGEFRLEPWLRVIERTPDLRVLDLMRTADDAAGVTWSWWWQLRRQADGANLEIALSVDPQHEAVAIRRVDEALAAQHASVLAQDLASLGSLPSLRLACNVEADGIPGAGITDADARPVARYVVALTGSLRQRFDEVRVVPGGPLA